MSLQQAFRCKKKSDLGAELNKIILWQKDGGGKNMHTLDFKNSYDLICRCCAQWNCAKEVPVIHLVCFVNKGIGSA